MKHLPFLKPLAILLALLPAIVSAQEPESVMVVETYSGKILVASNATTKRPIASLTMIATGAVTADWATATDSNLGNVMITAPQTVALVGGPNPMNLQPGDQLTMRDALYSALLGSDNLAAICIADHVGREIQTRRGKNGDPVATFVGEMNKLAKALGMTQTQFANPHGLERPGAKAYSTAADVARLSAYAMTRNAFNFIVRQPDREVSLLTAAGKKSFKVRNSNELIGEPGVLGVKTGLSSVAGPCVSICMDREPLVRMKPDGSKGATPRRLIVVVLNHPDRFNRARGLVHQGWAAYDPWLEAGAPVQDRDGEFLSMPKPN
jgi:serine-type D-Ala-D-Ala carboxypeptidase (penicillin-binding protein 5/6)